MQMMQNKKYIARGGALSSCVLNFFGILAGRNKDSVVSSHVTEEKGKGPEGNVSSGDFHGQDGE